MALPKKVLKTINKYRNTLVIYGPNEIVKLLDLEESTHDYYWVLNKMNGIERVSVVAQIIPLKGYIPNRMYKSLLWLWEENKKRNEFNFYDTN